IAITPVNDAPVGSPTISGTTTQGQTLTASASGISDVDELGTFSYQWQSSSTNGSTGWSNIAGATASTYTLSSSEVGRYVRAQVSYTDGGGTRETVSSIATASTVTGLNTGHNLINGVGGAGFGTQASFSNNDDATTSIPNITNVFPGGIKFGSNTYTSIWINTNGMITFGSGYSGFNATGLSGGVSSGGSYVPAIAAYWMDLYLGSQVTASSGGTSTGSNKIYYALDTANKNIIVTWDDVASYSDPSTIAGAFQIILHNAGSSNMDIMIRYEYTKYGSGFTAGWNVGKTGGVAGTDYYVIPTGLLGSTDGNTGQTGIWSFSLRDGGVSAATTNTSPSLATNTGLTLLESAASTTIPNTKLQVTDSEQAATALTYTLTSLPTKGVLTKSNINLALNGTFTQADVNNNLIRFVPTANLNGSDSFSFTVSDGAGGTTTGTFNLSITSVNSVPTLTVPGAVTFTDTVLYDVPTRQKGTLSASDGDGDTLVYGISGATASTAYSSVDGTPYNIIKAGSYGDLYLNSQTGAYAYVPDPVRFNTLATTATDSFTFTVTDNIVSSPTTQVFTVTLNGVNDAPIITSYGGDTATNIGLVTAPSGAFATFTASDAENSPLSYSISGGADSALFSINSSTGVLSFITTPDIASPTDRGANNVYNVNVTVSDGARTDTQYVAVHLGAVAPTLTAFSSAVATTLEDGTGTLFTFNDLLTQGNETDSDGSVTGFVVKQVDATNGTLLINGTAWNATTNAVIDATHWAQWTPAADVSGNLNAFT
ncbi:MAG: cadherin-like domain-containing protein, partial [Methylococcaceae bacterium]